MLLPETERTALPYADLGPRLGAAVVDAVIQFVLAMGSTLGAGVIIRILVFAGVLEELGTEHDMAARWETIQFGSRLAVMIAFAVSSGVLYRPLCESSAMQATIGKRIFGVLATDRHGARLTLTRAFARTFLRAVATFFLLALPTIVCIAVRKDRKGPHDLLAGTANVLGKAEGYVGLWRILVILVVPVWWVALTMIAVIW